MRDLNVVAEQLFNEIRGRFPSVTIGDGEGNTTNEPYQARFYEFDYKSNGNSLGKVSVSLDEKSGVTIMYNKDFTENAGIDEEDNWYNFLKGMRNFAKKRLLNFEVRDINKSNFTQRDYSYMAANRGETKMNESALRGTDKTSFQKIGNAKLRIKHTGPIGEGESRTKKIGSLFIENAEGEKFKYPFKHLSGARAMAIHVSEGGHPFDDFGKHITGLSEELSNLRKFKTYMGRSSVMAESLAEHMDTVNERIVAVKKTIQNLQKPSNYKTAFESFEPSDAVEVPEDVAENWIDQLTVKQFNEELKDVFPYIYKLVGESTKANDLDFDDIIAEARVDEALPVILGLLGLAGAAGYAAYKKLGASNSPLGKALQKAAQEGDVEAAKHLKNLGAYADGGDSKTLKMLKFKYLDEPASMNTESAVDVAFDKLLGQFADNFSAQVEGDMDEGNAYAKAVRMAKFKGAKKGDEIDGPDGEKITIEKDQKTPLGEFILSYFDRQTGQFPKGETAVLTSVEKDYGDQYVKPASQFIERLGQVYEKYQARKMAEMNVEEGVWDAVKGAVSGGIQGAKQGWSTSKFETKAQELANKYAKVAPQAAKDPNSFIQGGTLAGYPVMEALLDIYQELHRLGGEIKQAGGGESTKHNAMQMIKNINRIRQGDQNALRRLINQVGNEARFIMDFVKKDIASISSQNQTQEDVGVDQVYEFMGVDSKDEVDQNLMKAIQKKFGTKPVGDIRGRTYGDGDVEIDDPAVQMMLDAGILTLNPEAEKAYNAISPAKRAEIRRIIDRFQADQAQRTDNPNAQRTDNPNAQNAPGSLFDLLGDSTELDRISSLAGLK